MALAKTSNKKDMLKMPGRRKDFVDTQDFDYPEWLAGTLRRRLTNTGWPPTLYYYSSFFVTNPCLFPLEHAQFCG